MRRRAPRPLSAALEQLGHASTPQTLLARVQAVWADAVGAAIAAEAQPVSERGGTLTVACRSATWASELELLAPALIERLDEALSGSDRGAVTALRPKVAPLP